MHAKTLHRTLVKIGWKYFEIFDLAIVASKNRMNEVIRQMALQQTKTIQQGIKLFLCLTKKYEIKYK